MSVPYTMRLKYDIEQYEGDISNKILFVQRIIDDSMAVDIFNMESRVIPKKVPPAGIAWQKIDFGNINTTAFVFVVVAGDVYISLQGTPHSDAVLVSNFWGIGGEVPIATFYIGNDSTTTDVTVEIYKAGAKP